MTNKLMFVSALAGALTFASRGEPRDLVWNNAAGTGLWNLTDANWHVKDDPEKSPVCFASGDNAWFLDLSQAAETVTVCRRLPNFKISEQTWDVGRFVVSNEFNAFTFNSKRRNNENTADVSNANWYTADSKLGSFEKWGAADVRLNFRFEDAFPVNIYEGRFITGSGSDYVGEWYCCLGSLYKNHDIYFWTNSTLRLEANATFGAINSATSPMLYLNGATLDFAATGLQNFPKTVFNDASLSFSRWPSAIYFSNNTEYHGTKPYVYTCNYPLSSSGVPTVTFGRNKAFVDVRVDDVTDDARPDLIFSNRVVDVTRTQGTSVFRIMNTFQKKGLGTMAFHNPFSTTTGNFEVVEGTLEVGGSDPNSFDLSYSTLGRMNPAQERTITVMNGATIDFKVKTGVMSVPRNWKLVVDGGTLRSSASPALYLGALELNDATVELAAPYKGWLPYGYLSVTRLLKFGGKMPCTLACPSVNADQAFLTIGFTDADRRDDREYCNKNGQSFTNLWSVLEMDVADITGNAETDATIGLIIRNMYNMTWRTDTDFSSTGGWGDTMNPYRAYRFLGGIKKTGAGTLRLTNTSTYNYTTEIAAGALVVDGSIAASSGVTVDAGAYLGGTGTVAAVSFKNAGGLLCSMGAKDVLKSPSVTAEGSVVVKVQAPAGADKKDFHQDLLQITGRPASVDFTNWSVSFPGAEGSKGFVLKYDAATGLVSGAYAGGTLVIFR